MNYLPSKELLTEILGYPKNIPYGNEGKTYKLNIVSSPYINENGKPDYIYFQTDAPGLGVNLINGYELANKNLKEWAKLKSVFDIIDWSEEPEQIFKKAEELRNEIN